MKFIVAKVHEMSIVILCFTRIVVPLEYAVSVCSVYIMRVSSPETGLIVSVLYEPLMTAG